MIDDHGLTVSGKSGGRGIDRPTQGCHANLYQRLLDVPIVGRLHAPEYIKLNVQRVLVQVLAQISGQCAFARAARTVEYDDAPRGAQRFSNRHLGTCRRPANAGSQSIVVQATHGVERPFVAGCRPTRLTIATPEKTPAIPQTSLLDRSTPTTRPAPLPPTQRLSQRIPRSQNMRGQSRTRRVHIPLAYRPNDVPMFVVRAILPVELLPRRIQMP